jgi:hypothetical protein
LASASLHLGWRTLGNVSVHARRVLDCQRIVISVQQENKDPLANRDSKFLRIVDYHLSTRESCAYLASRRRLPYRIMEGLPVTRAQSPISRGETFSPCSEQDRTCSNVICAYKFLKWAGWLEDRIHMPNQQDSLPTAASPFSDQRWGALNGAHGHPAGHKTKGLKLAFQYLTDLKDSSRIEGPRIHVYDFLQQRHRRRGLFVNGVIPVCSFYGAWTSGRGDIRAPLR